MRTGDVVRAVVVSALVLSTACGDSKPEPLPSPSPSSVSVSPTPTVPASVDYEAEARRAVDAYFAALNAALRDPAHKTDALAALIAPSCPCRQVLDLLHGLARDGYYIDYRYSPADVRVLQAGPLGASIDYTVHQTAGSKRTSAGKSVRQYPASTVRYSTHFRHDGEHWLLDRVDQVR